MSADVPNIVVIMADQLAPHFTGAYGHPIAKTPHLDALAARGVRFDAAYCNSPLCAPSRFAFMSGQLISRIAAYDNASEFRASVPTFAHYMRMLGYRTCLSGKMHFVGPDQMHGFQDRVTTDIYPADFAWTPDWEAADERIDKWYHNMQTVKESGPAVATFQTDYDDEVGFAARRWLIDRGRDRAAGDAAPFLLVASFIHPHDPYVAKPEWWNLYSDDQIDMPEVGLPPEAQDPFSKRIMDGIEASYVPLTDEEVRRARRAYLANVSYFDSKIGEIVKTLDEMGETENTIVIVTADHGDMLGARGLWYKMNFFEHSARVPLVMAGPGVAQGVVSNACSLVDMLPTFVDLGGGDTGIFGEPVDGRSLVPLMRGETDTADEAIGEYCAEMTPAPVFMIRRGRFKFIHCDVDPPQLYDLENDPSELVNLANDAAYTEQAAAFASEVTARWDSEKLKTDIVSTQRTRRALHAAMEAGASETWDYNPPRDASQEYVRNHMDWTVAASRYRFPPLGKEEG
ncbi:choline-sulfatase [Roseovarius rhodophyticola]|uniref:Choline-sulfatase n=1 Tax=Roseovarius rhodophyticola TaxID=3080827 RepID=A0ABZ2TA97_9RHOB|nr:choline-sulfatase [Roseovarius sp. W115]MDV2930307.1 choline-sulfatase [Roseovarius sp. W115]